jgi:flagellar motor switch protein FliM
VVNRENEILICFSNLRTFLRTYSGKMPHQAVHVVQIMNFQREVSKLSCYINIHLISTKPSCIFCIIAINTHSFFVLS